MRTLFTTLNLNRTPPCEGNRFRFFVLYEKPCDKQLLSERANTLIKARALTIVRALCNRTIKIVIDMIVKENNFIDEIMMPTPACIPLRRATRFISEHLPYGHFLHDIAGSIFSPSCACCFLRAHGCIFTMPSPF